jgi:hypothetical protein
MPENSPGNLPQKKRWRTADLNVQSGLQQDLQQNPPPEATRLVPFATGDIASGPFLSTMLHIPDGLPPAAPSMCRATDAAPRTLHCDSSASNRSPLMLRPVLAVCRFSLTAVLLLLLTPLMFAGSASAQDFKVGTRVFQRDAANGRWNEVGQSVTLFHAGKVYDYMQQVGEVVVHEPAEIQFVIFSFNGNDQATTLHFSQLQQFLKVARTETEVHLQTLARDGEATARRRQALQFQLDPHFEHSFDPARKTLTLISPLLRYEVTTEKVDRPQVARQYLQYADWAARMNYVLHSGSLYPSVRLQVNRALAERDLIPTEVRLLLDGDQPLHLKAEHKFEWTLGTIDKSMIRKCEQARTAESTRWVNFQQYQRTLAAQTAQR